MFQYLELSGETQESLYNTGRAFHHVGLAYLAVDYYERALGHRCSESVGLSSISSRIMVD